MNVSNIIMSSYWGREVKHKYITQGSKALAVIFPGKIIQLIALCWIMRLRLPGSIIVMFCF